MMHMQHPKSLQPMVSRMLDKDKGMLENNTETDESDDTRRVVIYPHAF